MMNYFNGLVCDRICGNCGNEQGITRKQYPRLQRLKFKSVPLLPHFLVQIACDSRAGSLLSHFLAAGVNKNFGKSSNRVRSGERQRLVQPNIGAQNAPALLKDERLRLVLREFDGGFCDSFLARQIAAPDFNQTISHRLGQKFPQQFVLGADERLRAAGVALTGAAPEKLPINPAGFVPF